MSHLRPTQQCQLTSIPEMGIVFHDASGTVWNQIDTPLTDDTIDEVRRRFGPLDVLLAMYASQNFEFFDSLSAAFPTDTHRRNLETAIRIGPRTVVPASAGFRFCGEHEWLNAFLFPISRERFVTDLGRLAPGIDTQVMNPGDVLDIADGAVEYHGAASPAAHTDDDDSAELTFDPSAPIPPLVDTNPDGYPPRRLEHAIDDLMTDIGRWAATTHDDPVLRAYRERHVRYRMAVVFPDGREPWHQFDFADAELRVHDGESEPPDADLVHRIAASALTGWIEHTRSFFSVRASSRRTGTTYTLERDVDHVRLEPRPLPDLLMYYRLRVAPGWQVAGRTELDLQLEGLGVDSH